MAARALLATFCTLLLALHPPQADGGFIKGSVDLFTDVFDKIVEKFDAALIKFDQPDAYGEPLDQFKRVAAASMNRSDILVAEVHVAGYFGRGNMQLAERYGVNRHLYPHYKLFLKGRQEPIDYTGDTNIPDNIIQFVSHLSGLWFRPVGRLQDFDKLTAEFLEAPSEGRKAVMERAMQAAKAMSDAGKRMSAGIYVKIMREVLKQGDGFVAIEQARVSRLQQETHTDQTTELLERRANILKVFHIDRIRDEL